MLADARQVVDDRNAERLEQRRVTHATHLQQLRGVDRPTAEDDLFRAGDVAAWPKGVKNGHHIQNRGTEDCVMIAVSAGDNANDHGEYPDIDLKFDERVSGNAYLHKDGTPYPAKG